MHILVAGGGVFGLTAALALRARGHDVTLVDPGPIPHPLAESTDLSKAVRADYGADLEYTILAERAIDEWRRWNRAWPEPPFVETGVTYVGRVPMAPGGFEHDSYAMLTSRGHRLERLDAAAIHARFPAWRAGVHVDGYFNPSGGWARAAFTVDALARQAAAAGVAIRTGARVERLTDRGAMIGRGADRDDGRGGDASGGDAPHGEEVRADLVVLANGAWAAALLPELAGFVRPTGQPVFHLRPDDPSLFEAARFPTFGADISRTGWYGFPVSGPSDDPRTDRVVKIANHGIGTPLAPTLGPGASPDADAARVVAPADEAAIRAFVADAFPALTSAPITFRRLCVYGDTPDGHLWIARHPERANVAVATGGSGHAFKLAPVLGDVIADLVLGEARAPDELRPRLAHKFRWRTDLPNARSEEAARHRPTE